jgi:ribosome-dependent ATPase
MGRLIGEIYPSAHYLTITRGAFSKGLAFHDLHASFWPLVLAVLFLQGAALALLKKQEA